MLTPQLPDRMGLGMMLGFCVPVTWVLVATHNANSIDRVQSQAIRQERSMLVELQSENTPKENLSTLDRSDLKSREAQILAQLGWKQASTSTTSSQAQALAQDLEETLNDPGSSVRAGMKMGHETSEDHKSSNTNENPQEDMSPENAALLAALVAEYEELEKSAEALLHTEADDLQSPRKTASHDEVAAPGKVNEESVKQELKADGLKVVGEGKQWIERGNAAEQAPDQKVSYNPHFGRLELIQPG